jgi:hypothetical protein
MAKYELFILTKTFVDLINSRERNIEFIKSTD